MGTINRWKLHQQLEPPVLRLVSSESCCLCLETLPYLYDQYEEEADYLLARTLRWMKKTYKQIDKEYIRKIPRGPVKVKKQR
ncbi:hypothetical protein RHSIM_Rhsim12G0141900 [Rhododendron simsii]|uniref:Uncharacterized protein n=1 Tax=Rhododendron simsii TaxID=118357 RepID=A0A834L8Q9_RHOSS|nr:hypothetical protein RHSIM_Rhsim12G0141900 [Rhododendron simsii]